MNLVTDKGCFNMDLRQSCRIIAIVYLILIVIGAIFTPNYFTSANTLFGFVVQIIGNACLLFGAQLNNQWLVLVWLIFAVINLIGFPIAILGVIFNFGPYRHTAYFHNPFLVVLEYLFYLICFLLIARIVYSFWQQLRRGQSNPQHSVVV